MLTEDENEKAQKLADAKTELVFLVYTMLQTCITVAGDNECYLPSRIMVGKSSPPSICY